MTSPYRLVLTTPMVGSRIESDGTMNTVPRAWIWLTATRCCLPTCISSYGWLTMSCPPRRSNTTRKPGISPIAENNWGIRGSGTSATASRTPTPATEIGRTTNNTQSPVTGLRSGPATTAAPPRAVALKPSRLTGKVLFQGFGRAEAHIPPAGRSRMMSRKAKVWKFSARSRRPAAWASTCSSGHVGNTFHRPRR